jgi:hypothetical protein
MRSRFRDFLEGSKPTGRLETSWNRWYVYLIFMPGWFERGVVQEVESEHGGKG